MSLSQRKEVAQDLTELLHQAVISLDQIDAKFLLDKGASPSSLLNNTTALHLAVKKPLNQADEKKALAILQMLIDKGGDINQVAAYRTVMNLAGHNSFWSAVLLIAANRKTDMHDNAHFGSALLDAVRFCEDEDLLQNIVYTLLEQGAHVSRYSNNDGYTVLHWAVEKNKAFVLRLLLAKYPEECLRKSVVTKEVVKMHPERESMTPARMAFNMQKWDCLWAIAEVVYLPIIEGKSVGWPVELEYEKDIIFKYVCSLPPAKKWAALLANSEKNHVLRRLNNAQTGMLPSIGDTATVRAYKDEKKLMEEQGYPGLLKQQPVLPPPQVHLRTSPQMFQSAPRIIPNYMSVVSTSVREEPVFASSPLFFFSPPPQVTPLVSEPSSDQSSSHQSSPAIPIKQRRSSASPGRLTPQKEEHHGHSPSTSPQEFLAELFSGESSSHTYAAEDDGLRSPSRF